VLVQDYSDPRSAQGWAKYSAVGQEILP
jgi:hypothetical protein